jgi:hypothetical protein
MPRDGSGVYSRPAGIDAVTDTTIESAKYNLNVQDVEADLNTPRPISSGGTGASNAADAMVALGGEIANQLVTNYDTFVFQPGSFASAPGATSEPFPGGYASGICYAKVGPALFLEARQTDVAAPSPVKVRAKSGAGIWGPWTLDNQPATDLANTKVAKLGDTMTGDLTISKGSPILALNATAATASQITGEKTGLPRWVALFGDTTVEGAGNTGTDFQLQRFDNAGALIDTVLYAVRATGHVGGNGFTPIDANDFTDKAYVDAGVNAKVAKAGDTMTGNLVIAVPSPGWPTVQIRGAASTAATVDFFRNTAQRWSIQGLHQSSETGSGNAGSDFMLHSFDDGGSYLGTQFTIVRASGNVGIGTATPGTKLDVNGSMRASAAAVAATLQATAGPLYVDAAAGQNATVYLRDTGGAAEKGYLLWDRASNVVKMSIASGGEVSIDANNKVRTGYGTYGRAGQAGLGDANAHNFYWTGSVNQMWLDATNLGTVAVTCDYRIKKDVVPLDSMWTAVKALKPISYTQAEFTPPANKVARAKEEAALREANPKAEIPIYPPTFVADDIERWGFIAHELQETLLPTAATGEKDSPNEVQSPNLMAICAALTKALQEAMARIEALEAA